MNGLRLRPARPEDHDELHAIAAETPALKFREDVFAWPTVEVWVVEDEAERIVGFGYLEAIPEGHLVMRRRGTTKKTRWSAVKLLLGAAEKIRERLDLRYLRFPMNPDASSLTAWMTRIPNIQGDPRHFLALVGPGGNA